MSARGETLLRSAAEQLQNPDLDYIERAGCAGTPEYALPDQSITESGYTVTMRSVSFWTGAPSTPVTAMGTSFDETCPASDDADLGLQQIVLEVTHPDGGTDELAVVKRRS